MRPLISSLCLVCLPLGQALAADPARASAVDEPFPLTASVSLGYAFNHSNFAQTESDAVNLGYQRLRLSPSIGYAVTDRIRVGVSTNIDKELSNSLERAAVGGAVSPSSTRAVAMTDITLGTSWRGLFEGPAGLSVTPGFEVVLPTSRASQASGLVLSLSPSVGTQVTAGPVTFGLTGYYTFNINENPTLQIDCDTFPHLCNVAGPDVGNPTTLHELAAVASVRYSPLEALSVGVSYLLRNSYGAVSFPDDEFTAEAAQTGTQAGLGQHRIAFNASWRLLEKTSLSVSMATSRRLYTNDNQQVTVPLFDTDSDTAHRTSYGISVTQSL